MVSIPSWEEITDSYIKRYLKDIKEYILSLGYKDYTYGKEFHVFSYIIHYRSNYSKIWTKFPSKFRRRIEKAIQVNIYLHSWKFNQEYINKYL